MQNGLFLILSLVFFLSFSPHAYALYGDVAPLGNPDGEINIGDAVVVARMVASLVPADLKADVAPLGSPDGEINIGDAVVMARVVAGLAMLPDSNTVLVKYSGTGNLYGYLVSFTAPDGVTLVGSSSCSTSVDGVSLTVNTSAKTVVGVSTSGLTGPTSLFKCTFKDSRTTPQTFKVTDFSMTGSQTIGANGESIAITSSEYSGVIFGVIGTIAVSSSSPTSTTTTSSPAVTTTTTTSSPAVTTTSSVPATKTTTSVPSTVTTTSVPVTATTTSVQTTTTSVPAAALSYEPTFAMDTVDVYASDNIIIDIPYIQDEVTVNVGQ